ncbi:alkylation response protein AidB-like acyl-CoA dehydrogenase [Kineosphaera limosa]|uniref:Acyl-CoA dehydrogenase n=1 Tax=Kineosphaera limosa NBRC 100340 TaxID=1184609 RepID=K6WSD7_9MICO|nr:acyl-CoA dehydrogenase family protein [Kineosphaera limosa]NYE01858.1 alkylation response protein AidB-like acyl-CoA dehydrogenase [Kineosphaera limosa]GAB96761.1 acyl-CoA dehydrogenase [Kineosphaera limosa NBRC 100340]
MFELSNDHEDFRKVVRDFAEQEVAPHVAQWDRDAHFPVDLVPKMGELGLFGMVVPEEFGGHKQEGDGGEFTYLCLAIEELGRIDQSIGITLSAGVGLGINPILTYGTTEQKERWLPDLVAGQALAGFGLTEPDAGSDAGATKTKARLEGEGDDAQWVVDGAKAFITNSGTPITSVVTVTARTGTDDRGRAEISSIMIPSGTPGFTVEPAYHKLGWHISDTHGLNFENARVPADHLLGERGAGFKQFLKTLDDGRIAISALAVGMAQAMLEQATEYAKTRIAFGSPIGTNQGVSFQIADLAVSVEAARLLTYKAAWLKDEQEAGRRSVAEVKKAASIAKLYSTEAAVTATRIAVQVFGGNGFMEEYPVARFYRDGKILEIGEGTSEVQRMLIARSLGLPTA